MGWARGRGGLSGLLAKQPAIPPNSTSQNQDMECPHVFKALHCFPMPTLRFLYSKELCVRGTLGFVARLEERLPRGTIVLVCKGVRRAEKSLR